MSGILRVTLLVAFPFDSALNIQQEGIVSPNMRNIYINDLSTVPRDTHIAATYTKIATTGVTLIMTTLLEPTEDALQNYIIYYLHGVYPKA